MPCSMRFEPETDLVIATCSGSRTLVLTPGERSFRFGSSRTGSCGLRWASAASEEGGFRMCGPEGEPEDRREGIPFPLEGHPWLRNRA